MLQENKRYTKFTALVVDDDEVTVNLVSAVLTKLGFGSVLKANDGSAGLSLVKSHVLDIIICDLAMTPMDGLTFLKILRSSYGEKLAETPVLMFTGHSDLEAIKSAAALNVKGFIVKPSRPRDFAEKVNAAMAQRVVHEERVEDLRRRMIT